MLKIIFILFFILIFINISRVEHFFNRFCTINNVVDQVYVINLDTEPERFKLLSNNLKKLNIKFKRYPAINGKKIYHKFNNKTTLNPGTIGCLLSHKYILLDAIKHNYKKILVLEDDVIFDKNFINKFNEKYNYFNRKVPKFDLLYLGCSQTTDSKKMWNSMYIDKHFYYPKKSNGTFAMLLNHTIYRDLINCINKYDEPYDKMIVHKILNTKKCYSIYPHLITAKVDLISSTDNKIRNMDEYLINNRLNKDDFF